MITCCGPSGCFASFTCRCALQRGQRKGTLTYGHLLLVTARSPLLVLMSHAHFIAILTGREPKWPADMQ